MKGTLGWFVQNPVAANLVMLLILAGGFMSMSSLNKELFPSVAQDVIQVSVAYPGAGPREVEEQICIRIEEAIQDLDGVKRIRSWANFGGGNVSVELKDGVDVQKLYNDIKTRVDGITTLPGDSERPQISQSVHRERLLRVAIAGEVSERQLKEYGRKLREELVALNHVDIAELNAVRNDEVAIEVSEFNLRRYGLNFDDVVNAIRQSSVNLPAGLIRSSAGDFQVQTKGQAYEQSDFERIPLVTNPDGTKVLIGDVATVTDGFADTNVYTRFDGTHAVFIDVFSSSNPDLIKTSEAVNAHIATLQGSLPSGIAVSVWSDLSFMFKGRMNLLATNALGGLFLVFIVLMLFLRPLLAMWVALGIGTAYMGAIWMLPMVGVSVNMLSMFAFLLILGIIVDDAIIVGESIYAKQQKGLRGEDASLKGAESVYKPVLFAVVSTMVVFVPMLFLPGNASKFMWSIPVVVICALTFSLIESFWILPSHLSSMKPEKKPRWYIAKKFEHIRRYFSDGLEYAAQNLFHPFIKRSLRWYHITLAGFLVAFSFAISLVATGYVGQVFQSNPQMDWVVAELTFPEGSSREELLGTIKKIEQAIPILKQDEALHERGYGDDFILHNLTWVWENRAWIVLELSHDHDLNLDSGFIAERWRSYIGELPNVEKFELAYTTNSQGSDITIDLFAYDIDTLDRASEEISELLRTYPGVSNVRDSLQTARDDIDIRLKPNAETLGVSLSSIARQVRQGYFGEEAQRIPRVYEDVKVMVRYPEDERSRVEKISDIRVRTADRYEVPFETVATVDFVPGFTFIERTDRRRSIYVSADVEKDISLPGFVMDDIMQKHQQRIETTYPGLQIGKGGSSLEEEEFKSALVKAFAFSLLVIYALMAIEFKSYLKPFGVLSAVPFGIMGAIFGHWIMGFPIDIASYFGILAAAGVVVNDNLVFIDRINQLRKQGLPVRSALVQAGVDRFRPIILTSITTFIGLVPIMLDGSMQARFLIPMVTSLAFGILFATSVTLIFVPALYLAGARLRDRIKGVSTTEEEEQEPSALNAPLTESP